MSASTQNQALSSLLFLYGQVLDIKLPWMDGIERAKRPVRVPAVLTIDEVRALLARLEGMKWQYVFPSRKLSADPRSGVVRHAPAGGRL